ncbi:MAG: type II toxin-antitoxin system VapC family toxin [Dehalococcoidia bacterium]|nr:type II toxin-antitoxin system VapC family toxin [Dehalococcoidia bacterium]
MICVDASVAAKWLLEEEHSDKADALYEACVRAGTPLVAPPLLPIELTNLLRRRMVRERFSVEQATMLLERFFTFPVSVINPETLHQKALALAAAYDLPAAYDAHYLALSQLLGCTFWTNDRKLVNTLGIRLPFVRWLGDFAGGIT